VPDHDPNDAPGHVFISYVREDTERVDRLQSYLEAAGIPVWRDTSLRPGENWETAIRAAINTGTLAFIACFSENSEERRTSYQYAELRLAIKEMQRRLPSEEWLIPVRFAPCKLPSFELGLGYTLDSLQRVDLFGDSWEQGVSSLVDAIRTVLEPTVVARGPSLSPVTTSPAQELPGQVVSSATNPASETLDQQSPVGRFDYDVFLLFASPDDVDIARRIQMELKESDYTVWWDEGQLIASEDFQEIHEAIKRCRFLVIVLSSAFVNSPYCRNELSPETMQLIAQAGVTVIPALYEMCPVPLALEPKEFSNFTTSPNKGLDQLLSMLRSIEGKIPPRPPGPTLRDAVNRLIARVNEAPELYVATDLGGTKAYISIMTREGDRLFDRKFTTKNHGDASALLGFLLTSIEDAIDGLHKTTGIDLDRIKEQKISAYGIAFAGPTDSSAGVIRDASNFTIKNYPLTDRLKRHLHKPVYVGNDANLGVLGELWKGVAHGRRNVIGIIVGTGIGGGIVINGKLYHGSASAAGEIGHMVIDPKSGVECGCHQIGCFEALASRRAIAKELGHRKKKSDPSDVRWEERNLGSAELADYYAAGDVDAVAVVTEAAKVWGRAVRTLLNVLNPDMVFFGGGFIRQLGDKVGDTFLEPVRDEAKKCMNSVYELKGKKVPIVLGSLDNPMLAGACLFAIRGGEDGAGPVNIADFISPVLDEDEVKVLRSIYNHDPQPTRISRDSLSDFYEHKLRELRNRGLIETVGNPSFKNAQFVIITKLGRGLIEDIIASS
jgi:predicted NBD/HSP70 family sugar kinase